MIGIFGGTFDPVHYGHIKPVLAIKESLKLSQVRFIPNRMPPHKPATWLNVDQRLCLLTEVLKDFPGMVIDRRELDRKGPSYMVDTLSSLKSELPGQSLVLIVGMDVFYGITTWHRWKSLFDLCHLVVTTRPGFQQSDFIENSAGHFDDEEYQFLTDKVTDDASMLLKYGAGKILLQSVPQVDVSATMIRDKLRSFEHNKTSAIDKDYKDINQLMPYPVYKKLRGFLDDT